MRFSIALSMLAGLGAPLHAQRLPAPSPPLLRPVSITVLAEFSDTGRGDIPENAISSPNGRLIVYGTRRGDLTIWNSATREHAVLVTGPVHVARWGPKGDMLVFQTHSGPLLFQGNEVSRTPGIWTIRIDSITGAVGEPPHLVAQVAVNHGVFLSPDEQTIAFAQWHGSYVSSLSVVPVTGGVPRILASGVEVARVRWSSDGSALFYDLHRNSSSPTRTRYRIPRTGGAPVPTDERRPVPVTFDANTWAVRDPATDKTVALMGFPTDVSIESVDWPRREDVIGVRVTRPRALRVLSLTDKSVHEVLDSTAEVISAPEWLADGRIAVIVRQRGAPVLLTRHLDGSNAQTFPVAHVEQSSDLFRLLVSPDGRYVAFVGRAGGYQTIELVNLATGRQRFLIAVASDFGGGNAPEGRGIGQLVWSEDSKRILYFADVWTAEPAVHEVTLTGGDRILRPLPQFIYGSGSFFFPGLRHSEVVEFVGARTPAGTGSVTLVPVDGSAPRVVLPEPALGGPLSPDGRTLAVEVAPSNRQTGIRLKLVSLEDGTSRNVELPFIARRGIQWHPDGRRLLVVGSASAEAPVSVYAVPINGNAPAVLAEVGSSRVENALAVSPDGRFAAAVVTGMPRATLLRLRYDFSAIRSGRNGQ